MYIIINFDNLHGVLGKISSVSIWQNYELVLHLVCVMAKQYGIFCFLEFIMFLWYVIVIVIGVTPRLNKRGTELR